MKSRTSVDPGEFRGYVVTRGCDMGEGGGTRARTKDVSPDTGVVSCEVGLGQRSSIFCFLAGMDNAGGYRTLSMEHQA